MMVVADRAFYLSEPRAVEPVSTVHNQHDAANKARRIRTEKHRGLLNIRDSYETSDRVLLQQTHLHRFRYETLHALSVFDWTRRDRVHAYAVAAPLDREIARQCIDTRLRRRHVKLHWRREVVKRRADVQNLSVMF